MLIDLIPDTLDVHGYVQARRGTVGVAPPLAIPTGRWTTEAFYPEASSTFSWVRPQALHGWTVWLREEDRERSRADLERLEKTFGSNNLTRIKLLPLCRELGCAYPGGGKRGLRLECVILQMERWWPWQVV